MKKIIFCTVSALLLFVVITLPAHLPNSVTGYIRVSKKMYHEPFETWTAIAAFLLIALSYSALYDLMEKLYDYLRQN